MGDAATIGLISDTHGLLRPEALTALQGADLIIHAGDICKPGIIEQLRAVAPVVAVRGNIDKGIWASGFPITAVAEARSASIYILHDIQQLDLDPAAAEFNIVVSGHSHKPSRIERSGVLYFEPRKCRPPAFSIANHSCASQFASVAVECGVHRIAGSEGLAY